MDFYNFFKGFFGLPNSVPPHDFYKYEEYEKADPRGDFYKEPNDSHSFPDLFSNPHDMHEFFEQQMNEIIKSFGIMVPNGPDTDSFFGDLFNHHPALPFHGGNEQQEPSTSLRDQYLKPGFDCPSSTKTDKDLDGKVDINEIDSILKQPEKKDMNLVVPYKEQSPFRHFYGKNMTTKTIMHPDGSVETTTTVQDNEGNQEKTVTHRNKDGEYTIVTKIDKDGREEREERFVNLNSGQSGNRKDFPMLKYDDKDVDSPLDRVKTWWSDIFNSNK